MMWRHTVHFTGDAQKYMQCKTCDLVFKNRGYWDMKIHLRKPYNRKFKNLDNIEVKDEDEVSTYALDDDHGDTEAMDLLTEILTTPDDESDADGVYCDEVNFWDLEDDDRLYPIMVEFSLEFKFVEHISLFVKLTFEAKDYFEAEEGHPELESLHSSIRRIRAERQECRQRLIMRVRHNKRYLRTHLEETMPVLEKLLHERDARRTAFLQGTHLRLGAKCHSAFREMDEPLLQRILALSMK